MSRILATGLAAGPARPGATPPPARGRRPAPSLGRPGPWIWTGMLLVAAAGFGLVPLFARSLTEAGLSAEAVAFWRFALTAAILLPLLPLGRDKRGPLLAGLATGLMLGLGWVAYVEALAAVPVATAGVLYMTYPLFALAFARLLFGLRPGLRSLAGAALVLLAAAVAAGPAAFSSEGATVLLALSLLAPATFGFAIVMLTGPLTRLSPLERVGTIPLGAALGLVPLVAGAPVETLLPPAGDWPLLAGIALATAALPQLIYVTAAPHVGPARAAATGSVELPTMIVVGWAAFGEPLTLAQGVAAALVTAAILLSPAAPAQPPSAMR